MPSEAQEFINEVWGLQAVAYVVLVLRYYSRVVTLGWGKFALDDYLIAVATVSKRLLRSSAAVPRVLDIKGNGESIRILTIVPFSGRLHSRICRGIFCRRVLERLCEQWHDR